MATCLEIVTDALVLCRVLGVGKEPKAAEASLGLNALQSLYDQWLTGGMFGELEDVYLTESDTAEEGGRYFVPTGLTLTAATSVYDDAGTTRQPRDMAVYEVLTEAGVRAAKLYDRSEWVDLLDLELSDEAPLSKRSRHGLAAVLATSGAFSSAFGADPPPQVVALARHFLRNVMGKKGSTQDTAGAEYF